MKSTDDVPMSSAREIAKFINYFLCGMHLSVIRQKGESQNGRNRKTKYAKFFVLCVSEGKKCFFGKYVDVLCFILTSVLRFALFALLLTHCFFSIYVSFFDIVDNIVLMQMIYLFFNELFIFFYLLCLVYHFNKTQAKKINFGFN